MNRFAVCVLCVALSIAETGFAVEPPKPYGPVPSPRQLRWHELEVYGFLHFGPNTFTDKEWGYGDEPETIFHPTDFDADQIASVAEAAGMRGLILTAKHHDGFCLWPSAYTEHSVKNSDWLDGKGDVVKAISEACRRHGLLFGVYLSPWDRNHADYGTPAYLAYYRNQLRELLTNYGPIFEVWFDGANGGDGYYGGARTTRRIDNRTYYDWENTWKIVRELQPDACMFSDAGPDVRWVGNEAGYAGETCWATVRRGEAVPGSADRRALNEGVRDGDMWCPAEVDVSIRPGWFYHASQDNQVKSVEKLLDIYYASVGRGCNLLLNIPPDRRGRIHENDAKILKEWHAVLEATFAVDLARGATVSGPARGGDTRFAPGNVVDGDPDTYWATDDDVHTASLVIELPKPTTFNVVRIREYLPLGQRIDAFALDRWEGDAWHEFAAATSIGARRLLRTDTITTSKIRLRITQAAACPAVSEVALFRESH